MTPDVHTGVIKNKSTNCAMTVIVSVQKGEKTFPKELQDLVLSCGFDILCHMTPSNWQHLAVSDFPKF